MNQELLFPNGILILGLILIIIAYIGSVLPGLPGPPLAMVSIFLLPICNLYTYNWFEIIIIVILSLIVIASIILDYTLPSLMTKNFGGSKYATWGSNLAIIACIFISTPLGPFAIIVGPFLGAFIGEIYAKKTWKEALKSSTGTLVGFLAGTFGKLIVCTFITIYYIILCVMIIPTLF
jgi:uncharacterized protein YqgC (DUF456 family)